MGFTDVVRDGGGSNYPAAPLPSRPMVVKIDPLVLLIASGSVTEAYAQQFGNGFDKRRFRRETRSLDTKTTSSSRHGPAKSILAKPCQDGPASHVGCTPTPIRRFNKSNSSGPRQSSAAPHLTIPRTESHQGTVQPGMGAPLVGGVATENFWTRTQLFLSVLGPA